MTSKQDEYTLKYRLYCSVRQHDSNHTAVRLTFQACCRVVQRLARTLITTGINLTEGRLQFCVKLILLWDKHHRS